LADSLIAATAKVHKLCLVTRNQKDFEPFAQEHDLRVFNPWQYTPLAQVGEGGLQQRMPCL